LANFFGCQHARLMGTLLTEFVQDSQLISLMCKVQGPAGFDLSNSICPQLQPQFTRLKCRFVELTSRLANGPNHAKVSDGRALWKPRPFQQQDTMSATCCPPRMCQPNNTPTNNNNVEMSTFVCHVHASFLSKTSWR
jgi:hypothetical protein